MKRTPHTAELIAAVIIGLFIGRALNRAQATDDDPTNDLREQLANNLGQLQAYISLYIEQDYIKELCAEVERLNDRITRVEVAHHDHGDTDVTPRDSQGHAIRS